jgi:hypothetical protein
MAFTIKEVIMRYAKRAILTIVAVLMFGGALALDSYAQSRGTVVQRPVIVRRAIVRRPFVRPYWGHYGFYDPWYDPYYYSPYLRYQDQKYYLESSVRGNERELREHQEKYRADGVITAKEQRELEDDIKDVRNSRARLNRFLRDN